MPPRSRDSNDDATSVYQKATFALLTQHGKERVIGPAFDSAFAARVRLVSGFDTDALGTFTHEVPRAGTQLDAVRAKARIGMELSGLELGLASEGSFGPGPLAFFSWNVELVILIDARHGIEILGRAQAPAQDARVAVATRDGLDEAARRAGFPGHGLVLRAEDGTDTRLRKGLQSWSALHGAFADLKSSFPEAVLSVENDLRAHMNPTRMNNIALATADLVQRMQRACPECGAPGFGLMSKVPGLPCRDCGEATQEVRAELHGCVACAHRVLRGVGERLGDPASCLGCNP
ncbi:MAG: hypothetical protein NTY35_04065 [Planctomycetota bacterium]|nr:hypothetical protein [Planctomycetota bacterium]